ncbi:MAG: hypothetical protein ABW277_19925 [Longimicrobiaceae bacterium]
MNRPIALALAIASVLAFPPAVTTQTFVNPALAPRAESPAPPIPHAPSGAVFRISGVPTEENPEQREFRRWKDAYEWTQQNPEAFRIAVDSAMRNPGYARDRMARNDPAFVAVGLAAIAASPLEWDDVLENVSSPALRDSISRYQDRFERRLLRVRRQLEGYPVAIIATGSAVESAGDPKDRGDDGKKPLGTGSLGVIVGTPVGRFMGRVSVLSTDAVAPADFGPMILTPGSGPSLSAGVIDWRNQWRGPNHFYLSGSAIRMRSPDTDSTVARATVFGAGALLARDLFDRPFFNTHVALSVEAGLAARFLDGDIRQDSAHFAHLFKDDRNVAWGPELGFALSFGRLTAAAQAYFLGNQGEGIPGLTRPQFVAGLAVSGELISDRVRFTPRTESKGRVGRAAP